MTPETITLISHICAQVLAICATLCLTVALLYAVVSTAKGTKVPKTAAGWAFYGAICGALAFLVWGTAMGSPTYSGEINALDWQTVVIKWVGTLACLGLALLVRTHRPGYKADPWDGKGSRGAMSVFVPIAMLMPIQCWAALAGVAGATGGLIGSAFTLNVPGAFASLMAFMAATGGWPAGC